MDAVTKALHTREDVATARPVVTPLFQCSAFQSDSPYFYTRRNNPNVAELEAVVGELEQAPHALAVTTGMTAIALVLDLLRPNDLLLLNRDIYGCSYRLVQRLAARRGFAVEVADLSDGRQLSGAARRARMVLFETPTNPFLKTIDIARVAAHVRSGNPEALVVVDNTWATPLFQRPLEHGADVSLHSATKYFSGHSDVMGGVVLTSHRWLHEELSEARFYQGAVLDPHSAWLLRRSLQTFALRMREHQRVTQRMRDFLQRQPQVRHVYHPHVDGRQLLGYGGILFVELREDLAECYPAFTAALRIFQTGTGMAAVSSMVAQPYTGSHASMTEAEKASIGLDKGLVRLCFGFEDPADLESDLLAGFAAIDA